MSGRLNFKESNVISLEGDSDDEPVVDISNKQQSVKHSSSEKITTTVYALSKTASTIPATNMTSYELFDLINDSEEDKKNRSSHPHQRHQLTHKMLESLMTIVFFDLVDQFQHFQYVRDSINHDRNLYK